MRRISLAALAVLVCVILVVNTRLDQNVQFQYGEIADTAEDTVPTETSAPLTLQVIGDVFLGRAVERLMNSYGPLYPTASLAPEWTSGDIVLGNFEAAIPAEHVPTPDFGFQFSVPESYLESLHALNVTHLSLANNHSTDFGVAGHQNTQLALEAAGFTAWGGSVAGTSSVTYVAHEQSQVAIVALSDVGVDLQVQTAIDRVREAAENASYVMVYMHWGTEYEAASNAEQQQLARVLVDAGASSIVGHHPHVVQEVDWYQGVPIFYSLGNFIFDQYFSTEVQEGLWLTITLDATSVTYDLKPITSIGSRSQPRRMSGYEREVWLEELSTRSHSSLQSAIGSGRITQTLNQGLQN